MRRYPSSWLTLPTKLGLKPKRSKNNRKRSLHEKKAIIERLEPRQMLTVTAADFDVDSDVDGADLSIWESNYGTSNTATYSQGDADGDRDVDGLDFLAWQRRFSQPVVNMTGADFDGDSRDDLAVFHPSDNTLVAILEGGGRIPLELDPSANLTEFHFGDFNGDERDDLMAFDDNTDTWTVAISNSTTFSSSQVVDGVGNPITTQWDISSVGDFDGDGSDELIGRDSSNASWQVLQYDERFDAVLEDWSAQLTSATNDPFTIFVGDVNQDGRDDLIGRKATQSSWSVAVSTPDASGVNAGVFAAAGIWTTWFEDYDDNVVLDDGFHRSFEHDPTSLNVEQPYQELIDIFSGVYNTVELELYRGFMKGAEATAETKSGNSFDQAALLDARLDQAGFDSDIVIGTIQVNWEIVRDWIGAPDSQLNQANKQGSVLALVQRAFDPSAISVGNNIRFNHAWVDVTAPTATDLSPISIDPSWKFKDFQSGILPADPELILDLNVTSFLADQTGRRALEFYEDGAIDFHRVDQFVNNPPIFVNSRSTGISIADIPYDGPILTRLFTEIPDAFASTTGVSLFQQLDSFTDFDAIVASSSARDQWTHRVEIDLRRVPSGMPGDGTSILTSTQLVTVPASAFVPITVTYTGNIPQLNIGGNSFVATTAVLPADFLKIRLNFFDPGQNSLTPNTRIQDFDTLDQRFVAVGLNGGQHSATGLASLQESTLANIATPGVEDTADILSLIATSYFAAVDRSTTGSAAATNSAIIRPNVDAVAISGDTDDFVLDDNAPYGFLLGGVEMNQAIKSSYLYKWNTAVTGIPPARLLFNDISSIEGQVLEDVFGTPSVSTIVGLKKAYLRLGGEDQSGTVYNDDEVLEIRITDQGNGTFLLTIVFFSDGGTTQPAGAIGTLPQLQNTLETQLVRHNDSQGNFLSQFIIDTVSAPGAFLDPDPDIQVGQFNVAATVFRVPKSFVRVGNWVGDVIQAEIFTNGGSDFNYSIGIREVDGLPLQGGASGGIPVPPNLLVPVGNGAFQPINEGTVNLANGNLVRSDFDIAFPNIGVPLDFVRRYNSQSVFTLGGSTVDVQAGFGKGWTHSFSDQLIHAGGDAVNPDLLWISPTGARHLFSFNGTTYDTPAQLKGQLEKVNSTTYRYLERDGTETHFETATLGGSAAGDAFARLSQKIDLNGNGVLVSYDDANSRPKNVVSVRDVHTADRRLDFSYDFTLDATNGHISSVKKFDGGVEIGTGGWTYGYQDLGTAGIVLTSVTSPTDALLTTSAVVSYEYHPQTAPSGYQGFLKRVTEPNGNYQDFAYYLNGRVLKSEQSIDFNDVGNPNDDTTSSKSYAYNLVNNTTIVTDERGNTETFRHNQDGLLIRQIHEDRSRVDSTWGKDDGTGTIIPETRFLITSRSDEVGGGETFDYYTSTDGFKEKELKSSIAKRYVRVDGSSIFTNSELVTEFDYVQATGAGRSHIVNLDTTRVDPTGENNLTDYDFDPQGRTIRVVDPLLNETTFDYYSTSDFRDGLLRLATSPRNHDTLFDYDAAGNLNSTSIEGQQVATTAFDHNGSITSFTDGGGVVTEAIYDVLGRRRSAIEAGNGTTSVDLVSNFTYDPSGQLLSTVDALGRETTFQYDARGSRIELENADETTVQFEYDSAGNLIAAIDELGRKSQRVYDDRNRLVQTIHPDGSIERIRYDGVGRIANVIDELGRETRFDYDAAGRPTQLIRALGTSDQVTTVNRYDLLGRLELATDGEGHIIQNVHDALGRVTKTQILDEADESQFNSPVNTPKFVSTFDYDADGNLERTVVYDVTELSGQTSTLLSDDPRSLIQTHEAFVQEVEFKYNNLNQFVETVYVDAGVTPGTDTSTKTLYDLAGRIRFQEDELGRITETVYDDYGRLQQLILPDPDSINPTLTSPVTTFSYDAVGNVLTVTDANQHTTRNTYDALNQLISRANAENETTRLLYDLAGQVVGDIDAHERALYFAYDNRGRTKLQAAADPDGDDFREAPKRHFEYDAVGNLTNIVDPGGYTTRFVYDALNRVVAEQFIIEEFVDDTDIAGGNFSFIGNATYDGNRAGAYGNDVTVIEGDGITAPSATWVFSDLSESGTYRISTTWDADPTLDNDADLKYEFVSGFFNISQPSGGGFNQQQEPDDFFRDNGGEWLGWQNHPTQFTLSGGTSFSTGPSDEEQVASDNTETSTIPITVTLTGSSPTSKIQADAIRIERFAQRTFTYDGNGNLKSETDSLGRTTDFTYDELSRISTVTSPDPDPSDLTLNRQVTEFEYDGYGNQTTIHDKRNSVTIRTDSFTYDKRNRLTSEVLNVGGLNNDEISTEWIYDDAGNVLELHEASTSVQDRLQSIFVYDDLNRLTEQFTTSVFGNPSQWTRKDTFAYDAVGNLTLQTETTQDLSAASQASVDTLLVYDAVNRLIRETRDNGGALESTSQFVYDDVGNLVQETDATGRTTTFLYDALNRSVEAILPDVDLGDGMPSKLVQKFTYNSLGDTVTQTNGENETTRFFFDSLGRQVRSINPNGEQIVFGYDSESNLLHQIDGENNVTSFQYDRLNRLIQETIVDQSSVSQQRTNIFNDRGNLSRMIDRNDRVREFTYDGLDRRTTEEWFNSVADADSNNPVSTLSWAYDQLSRLTLTEQVDDISGNRIYVETFDYDHLDRVTQHRNYDPNTAERLNPEVAQAYSYDRLASLIDPVSSTTDPGSFSEAQYVLTFEPQGAATNFANTDFVVDRLGRLGAIHDHAIAARSIIDKSIDFDYDAAGRLTEIDRTTSGTFRFITDYTYDEAGRLEEIDHRRGTPSTSPFATYDYQFDNASRITQVDATTTFSNLQLSRTETYGFDAAGQLNAFSSNLTDQNPGYMLPGGGTRDLGLEDITHSFGYDDAGNRNLIDGTANTIEANNRVTADGQFDYVYDDEGNLRFRRTQGGGPETEYIWDHRNRLTAAIDRATQGGSVLERIEYVYNNDDLRVRKTILAGGTTFESSEHYVYDGDQLAAIIDGTATPDVGTMQRRLVNGPGVDAPLFDEVYSGGSVDRLFYAAADHNSSVRDVLDGDNTNLVNHLEYDAFGEIALALNPFKEDVGTDSLAIDAAFAGREWDDDADLYYNRARWYNAELGRFISEDPAQADINLYRYSFNDPVNFRDPTGNFGFFSALIGIGVGLLVDFLDQEINGNEGGSVGIGIGIGIGGGGVDVNVSADIGDVRVTTGTGDPPPTSDDNFLLDRFPNAEQVSIEEFEANTRIGDRLFETESERIARLDQEAFFAFQDSLDAFGRPRTTGGGISVFTRLTFRPNATPAIREFNQSVETVTNVVKGGAEAGSGFIPLVGEAQDLAVVFGSDSTIGERFTAAGSLIGNFFTAGFAPNAGGGIRASRRLSGTADAVGDSRIISQVDVVGDSRVVSQFDTINDVAPTTVPRGGRNTALSGRSAEQAVSDATGIPLNRGAGRQTVPGTGRGGFRIPDLQVFGPNASLVRRGSIIEVKNVTRLSGTRQIRDLAEQARSLGGRLEIFTNAPAPTRGKLFDLIQDGSVILRPLPSTP